jgi:hypothetical protein
VACVKQHCDWREQHVVRSGCNCTDKSSVSLSPRLLLKRQCNSSDWAGSSCVCWCCVLDLCSSQGFPTEAHNSPAVLGACPPLSLLSPHTHDSNIR